MDDTSIQGSSRPPKAFEKRRPQNQSDETAASSRAVSLEQAIIANLHLEERLGAETQGETIEVCLERMPSTKSTISTASSFVKRQQAAVGVAANFREIGIGPIGKASEHPGTTSAYKFPLTKQDDKLWNNYIMHKRIETAFNSHISGFPREPNHILCMERIFPLPKPVRHCLIEKSCPPQGREQLMKSEANKDCLVRPYLGRIKYGTGGQFFSLRNFKLHANQIKDLEMKPADLYLGMAHDLGVMHWVAKIDGNDVEFVIGSFPVAEQVVRTDYRLVDILALKPMTSTHELLTHKLPDFGRRVTSLWMIDFDDCHDITMDDAGIDKAVKAFIETNHYCPRPNSGGDYIETMWKDFSSMYLSFSSTIMTKLGKKNELGNLPAKFVERLKVTSIGSQPPNPGASPQAKDRGGTSGSSSSAGRGGSSGGNTPSRGRGGIHDRIRSTKPEIFLSSTFTQCAYTH
ncbi:hypothetical protein CPAR01_06358 [Colletotrichum paranaense]|uniref:DUF3669 domain-containing protein n=1 Tax=Colletotrichum paranaense TaxID=1914294 RepID=A0ABQ9SMB7_9PEZI|nr:uncharacterized protein CPAR01_06358 [Colletotrichum paranaense]KAK1540369.1 hypothetical protein CPAR01_06358 [Colletotrichum paranaense]